MRALITGRKPEGGSIHGTVDRGPDSIACSLGSDELSMRQARWSFVLEQVAMLETARVPGRIRMRFLGSPQTLAAMQGLIAAERECCSSVRWHMDVTGERGLLDVIGPEDLIARLRRTVQGLGALLDFE